jgi:hypothetical protein
LRALVGSDKLLVFAVPTVMRYCAELEEALKPFGARPHWGKLFAMGQDELRRVYGDESFDSFQKLAAVHDPEKRFVNEWAERLVFGEGGMTETEAILGQEAEATVAGEGSD